MSTDAKLSSMRLDRLRVEGFRAIREADIRFPDGVIGIVGANGTGKSSVLWAITFAVAGLEAIPYKKAGLLGPGEGDCSVIFDFSLGATPYTVTRSLRRRDLAGSAVLRSGETEIARGVEAVNTEMARLIGSPAEWLVSRFVAQKQLNALSALEPAPRKRLILKMLGIDAVEAAIGKLREETLDLDRTIKSRRAALPDGEALRDERVTVSAELATCSAEIAALRATLVTLERRAGEDAALLLESERLAASLEGARDALRLAEEGLAHATEDQARLETAISQAAGGAEELAAVEAEIAAISASAAEFAEAERVKALRDGAAMRRLDAAEAERAAASHATRAAGAQQATAELKELRARLAAIEGELAAINEERRVAEAARGELRGRLGAARDAVAAAREGLADFERAVASGAAICPTCRGELRDPAALRAEFAREIQVAEALEAAVTAEGVGAKGQAERAERAASDLASETTTLRAREAALAPTADGLALARAEEARLRDDAARYRGEADQAEALPFDPARYESLRAAHDSLPDLQSRRGAALGRAAGAARLEEDLARIRERAGELTGKRDEAAARLGAGGYDAALHERRIADAAASAAAQKGAGEGLADRGRAEATLTARLAAIDERIGGRERALAEINDLLAERGRSEAARLEMERFKIELIGRIRPALERRASRLLGELTDGRYSDLVLDADYEISIGNGPAVRSIREISGGEEDLANLCLRIAISQLITESAGMGSTFIVLDEVLGSQDDARQERIMELLPRLAGHFTQVLMVAHIPNVRDRFEAVVSVDWDPATETSRIVYPPDGGQGADLDGDPAALPYRGEPDEIRAA